MVVVFLEISDAPLPRAWGVATWETTALFKSTILDLFSRVTDEAGADDLAVDFLLSPPFTVVDSSEPFAPVLPADEGITYFEAAFTSLLFAVVDWDWGAAGAFVTGWVDFLADFFPLLASLSLQVGQVNS